MHQFGLVLTLICVQHLKVVHLQSSSSSTTLSTEREIIINNFTDFQVLWTSDEDFTDNQLTIPNNPGNLQEVWYISSGEDDPSKIFKVSFNITEQACDTTELRIKIKYFSSNAAVTLYPILTSQDEYFNLQVSNPEEWSVTDDIDIDISDGKVEISGLVLPEGYFIFDEIKIIVNANYEDGCNPPTTQTTEISTTMTTQETTVYESVETEMISGSTAELTTFETTTMLIETTSLFTETEMTTEEAITEITEPPDFESSTTTNEEFTSESTTIISEPTTENVITSTMEESSSQTESTTENSMTSIRTETSESSTDSTSNPTTEGESSSSELSTTENSATESVFTSSTSERVISEYTSTATSGLSSIFSTRESLSTLSTIVPIISSTSESSNPNDDGLSTEDILLFIVVPSIVVLGILSVGFSVAYLSPWCKPSIGNKGISTVSNNAHGLGQVTPGPSHVSLNLQPSSEYEIPRPRFRHQ